MLVHADNVVAWELRASRLASGKYQYDDDGQLEKRCSRCREYWPADSEFFYKGDGDGDGLHCMCISCNVESLHRSRSKSTTPEQEPAHV